MNKECIVLNNIVYTNDNLPDLRAGSEEGWHLEICNFLSEWFSDTDVIITRTSGSTGVPKEICLPKELMRNSARMTNDFFNLAHGSTALLCLPASYIAGKMMLVRAIVGGYNLLTVAPAADPFCNLQAAVDFTAITPYQLLHSVESLKLLTVRNIIVGGAHVTLEMEKMCSCLDSNFYETYGMTETASHIALRRFNGIEKSDFFQVLKGVSICQDERGCLIVSAIHLNENTLITNDVVQINEDGNFKWMGRADTVINSGGVKIFPEQVERKLELLLQVRFFISSIPDAMLGSKVILVVESDGLGAEELNVLREKMRVRLEKYEIPKEIYFVPEFICSSSDKVLRIDTMKKITALSAAKL